MRPRHCLGILVAVAACTLGSMLPGPAAAGPKAPAPPAKPAPLSPMDGIKDDLLGIQNHVTNANMRLSRSIQGMSLEGAPQARARRTPAETCCTTNLEFIADRFQHLSATIDELDAQYARRRDSVALDHLKEMRDRLTAVAQGISEFRMAQTSERAKAALDGLIRPFYELRDASEELATCCPLAGAAATPSRK